MDYRKFIHYSNQKIEQLIDTAEEKIHRLKCMTPTEDNKQYLKDEVYKTQERIDGLYEALRFKQLRR